MKFTHKAAILFLILCLQFQAAAAIVMPCAHQNSADSAPVGCHQSAGDEAPLDGKTHFSCVKCALGATTGGFQGPASAHSAFVLSSSRPMDPPFHPRHYYHFVPEQPKRPPIV